ncbi:hypothetical protein ACOSQ2_003615 [Xanthoceras sorbifolium]
MNPTLNSTRLLENKEATLEWIASSMGSTILTNPDIKLKVLKNELLNKFVIRCGSQTIYKAKKKVLNNMKADHIKSYTRIENNGNTILAMNPSSMVKISLDKSIRVNPKFWQFYLSFTVMQIGFKQWCTPLIGVDGCHLTGQFERVMWPWIVIVVFSL